MNEPEKEAQRWFLQAEDDRRFVIYIRDSALFFDKGCFISQQAGEKALKACHYATGKRIVIGHSLYEMLIDLEKIDASSRNVIDPARRLDRFYIPTRYPNGLPGGSPFQVYTKEDLTEALDDLERIFRFCRTFLKKRGVLPNDEKNW